MGKRKLRFSYPKNWERKKHSAGHSVALSQPSTTSQPPATTHPTTSHDQPPITSPPPATPATSQPPATLPSPTTSQPSTTSSQPLTTTIGELKASVSCTNLGDWTVLSRDERLQICKFDYSNHQPSIVCCVEVQSSLEWTLYVRSVRIEASNISSLSIIPAKFFTISDVQNLLHAIDGCVICPANEYDTFAPLINARNGVLKDISGRYFVHVQEYLKIRNLEQ